MARTRDFTPRAVFSRFMLGFVICLALLGYSAAPALGQTVRKAGSVTVIRDDWGVPHIYAARESDGYFGLGYAMAEDRLVSVLRRYLAVSGRLASVFGKDSLEKDFATLQWMHLETARSGFQRMSPELQRNYRMFILGIDRYVRDHPDEAPTWTLKLEPALPIAWNRSWIFYWGEAADECASGGVRITQSAPNRLQSGEHPLKASNAWVLMPWRTADNATVLVGDSHSAFTGNGEMFEFHLDAGDLKISGTSGVANPWVIVGHTRYLAWTTTNRSYDSADCYEIEVDPANPRRYRYDGKWVDMVVRSVTVPVKNGAAVTRAFEYTKHNGVLNPVVARKGNKAWVASSPYFNEAGLFDEMMYRQMKAKSVDGLRAAQRMNEMWPTNLMAADYRGNVFYLRAGRIPVRPSGHDWSRPVPGNTSATAWKGLYTVAQLVQIENPATGYMQNNNVSPDVMFEGSPLTRDRYPPDVFADVTGNNNFRGRRTVNLLSRMFAATLSDITQILFDEKWDQADLWSEALRRALNRNVEFVGHQTVGYRAVADRITTFDGFASKESIAALNYLYWRRAISENQPANRTMVELAFHDSLPGAQYDSVLLRSVARATDLMTSELHSTTREFGSVFRMGRGKESWPLGGFVGTMRAMQFGPPDSNAQQWAFSGQRQPLVVIFSDPIKSYSALNFGQSNRPDSPHFADQSRLMSEKRLKPTYFYESDLVGHTSSRKTLEVR